VSSEKILELIEKIRNNESNFYGESSLFFDQELSDNVDKLCDVVEQLLRKAE